MSNSGSNPPKFYYNFMGTKADEDKPYYSPVTVTVPETDLSLSFSGSPSSRRPVRMLDFTGMVPRSQNRGVVGPDRAISVSPIRARYPAGHLKRRAEEPAARMVGVGHIPSMLQGVRSPMHAAGIGSGQFGPNGAIGRALGVSIAPRGVTFKAGDSPTGGSSLREKKPKYPTPESDDDSVVIIPRPANLIGAIPARPAQGDVQGNQVVVKGFVRSRTDDQDERVRIVCLCHGRVHSAEDFMNHCGAPVNSADPKCYITVTRSL